MQVERTICGPPTQPNAQGESHVSTVAPTGSRTDPGPGDASGLDLGELRGLVGWSAPFNSARDPVNEPMIRHWCDVLGEGNPVYTDPDAAAASAFGGIVPPPAMLDVWDKPGILQTRDPDNPQSQALTILDAHGF